METRRNAGPRRESPRPAAHRAALAGLVASSALLTWAPPALAQEPGWVLVVRARDEALASELADAVVFGLAGRGMVVRRPSRPSAPPADDSIARARAAYHALDPDEARRILDGWLARAERSGHGGTRAQWIEGLVWLALCRLALGDTSGADAALARALAVDPALALDPALYPPTILDRLEPRRAAALETATLRVEAEPRGASVEIDGEVRGRAPLALELPVGRHLVRVVARGHRPEGRAIDLGPEGAAVALRATINPELALVDAGLPGSPLPRAARAAAAASRERVLVLDLEGREPDLRATLREEGGTRSAAAGPGESARALGGALLAAWDAAAAPRAAVPVGGDDPLPWIAVGVGAAVVAAIAIGVGAALAQPSEWAAVGVRE